jgi:5'-3' exonuclease
MITDLGKNIVSDFLRGKTVIESFEVDFNCPENSRPYTPFQQLMAIMPHKSMHLLPKEYGEIARTSMLEYFPSSFECDLNGKTYSYEAIVLIPFVDEKRILEEEEKAFA